LVVVVALVAREQIATKAHRGCKTKAVFKQKRKIKTQET